MRFDPTQVLANARAASTDDLLDRVTAYRAGMEPEALDLCVLELHRRGVTAEQIQAHAGRNEASQRQASGAAFMCSWCRRPAIATRWGWHRLWGKIPLFPRRFRYCEEHRPHGERGA